MAEEGGMKPRTLKRKNVKGLMLKSEPKPATPPGDAQAPGGQANGAYSNREDLSGQLNTLEIGVEFKLDLRAEDLKFLHDLGAGNGGSVSKVMHQATRTVMAKKVIHIDAKPTVRKQIVRELHIMHECHSPYIVSFYGAFLNEGDVVMCMEYMDCGSLDKIAKKVGPIRIDVLGKISEAVVEGLHYLYNEHKILHRDIKPSNILFNSRGSIKLCDFGVSGELINSIANTFVGTSTYMAPERIQGAQYSVKSDVWSLGLSLLELAIGRFPFDADGSSAGTRASAGTYGILDLLQRIVHEPAPRLPKNPAFPLSLEVMIEHCLIKDPDKRPSPEELLSEPFMRSAKATNVDLEGWACEILEKSGKPHHRTRSSVSIRQTLQQRESPAPPRPVSRSLMPVGAPPPPPRRPSTSTESASTTPVERRGPPAPFPTRSSSNIAPPPPRPSTASSMSTDGRPDSIAASPSTEGMRMPPPPPPPSGKPSRPAGVTKAYTESASTSSMETQREREKMDREKEKGYGYGRQGTIGIGFEGGFPPPPPPREDPMPEMKEKRRLPPMATMSSGGNGGPGIPNGWERNSR